MLKFTNKKKNKFGAKKTMIDGINFDSKKEAQYYEKLRLMERAGLISDLELQPKYELHVNGEKIRKYFADFKYFDNEQQKQIIVDVKGYKKGAAYELYKYKRDHMKLEHGIEIMEI